MAGEVLDEVQLDDSAQQAETVPEGDVAESTTSEGEHDAQEAGKHDQEWKLASCHPCRRHYGHGLCKNCWQREWYQTRPQRVRKAGYMKEYYSKNRETIIENSKRNRKRYIAQNSSYILEHLATHPCVDCGEDDPVVLEFDHVTGVKVDDIAAMRTSYTLVGIRREIEKCEVRCANCHRRRTAERADKNYRLAIGAAISLAIN